MCSHAVMYNPLNPLETEVSHKPVEGTLSYVIELI